MKLKVSELTGVALDFAVSVCEHNVAWEVEGEDRDYYSTNWAQGGPIIERESIQLTPCESMVEWSAGMMFRQGCEDYTGPTPLIAAMRCYVASKLGDEVEIPNELVTDDHETPSQG
jgi:hypothetical protein